MALLAVVVLLPWVLHRQLLGSDAIFYELDSAQLHYVRYRILCDALQEDRAIPLWQDLVLSGAPFHANPENVTLYPPVVLLAFFCSPIVVMNLTILLHMSVAAAGAYFLVRRLCRRLGFSPNAGGYGGLGAALYAGLSYFMRLESFNLVAYGAAHALFPWILLAADAMLTGRRPWRMSGALGLLLALQVNTGGLYVVAYDGLGLAIWFVCMGLLGNAEARRRTLIWGSIAGGLALLVAAAKVFPYLEWVSGTNRAQGIDLETARGTTLLGQSHTWERCLVFLEGRTGWFVGLLWAVPALLMIRRREVAIAVGLVVLGFLVGLGGSTHRLLYELVPPFDNIRNAVRSWTLVHAFLVILIGIGSATVHRAVAARVPRRLGGALLAALLLASLWSYQQSWRFDELFANPSKLRHLAWTCPNLTKACQSAGETWRVSNPEFLAPGKHCEQLVTSSAGVETPSGFLGYAWHPEYRRFVLRSWSRTGREAEILPRRLGALSVGLVVRPADVDPKPDQAAERDGTDGDDGDGPTERPPVAARGGEPGAGPPSDAQKREWALNMTVPRRVDGVAVEWNDEVRHRAHVPARMVGVLGESDRTITYALMSLPAFRIATASLLMIGPEEDLTAREVTSLAELLVINEDRITDANRRLVERAQSEGIRVTRLALAAGVASELEAIAARVSAPIRGPGKQGATFQRVGSGRVRVLREEAEQDQWIVLSETWNLYGGWGLSAGAGLALRRADGILAAVHLPAGVHGFEAVYDPPSFRLGAGVSLLGLALAILLMSRRGKPRRDA